jgi:microsomal dipeptidase-like Zn-dependent dipeptidase
VLVDLHAHYPMHVDPDRDLRARVWMTNHHRAGFWEKVRALLLRFLNNFANFPEPGEPAVTIPNLEQGGVGVVLSMLYAPFDEMDLTQRYAAPPLAAYFKDICAQMLQVESEIADQFASRAAVAHNRQELQAAMAAGKVALIHAIEGGFQLGDSQPQIAQNVRRLAELGVAYVTVAHLFFRRVATNAPAIPFLPDWVYQWWFPQPAGGLTPLGTAAIRAMVENGILIDLTHMSNDSLVATLDLLDQDIDPERTVPVVATHAAYRFGKLKYNLTDDNIKRIGARAGVIGLIACDHFITDGLRGKTTSPAESFDVLARHIDKIRELTGSDDHIAIGSDLDGFIKPTLNGLELPSGFNALHAYLVKRYGAQVAEKIFSGNALRLLSHWGRKRERNPAPIG